MKKEIVISNLEELDKFADILTPLLSKGDIVGLKGDLGAGKTTLTKYVAKYLDINDNVTSPTFNILKNYMNGSIPLYHMDVYRLEGIGYDLELEDFMYSGDGISIIEWYDFIKEMLPKYMLKIDIKITENGSRLFTIEGDEKYEKIVEEISNRYSN